MSHPSANQSSETGQGGGLSKAGLSRWKVPALIDFEYFLETDRGGDPVELETRDREIYRGTSNSEGSVTRKGGGSLLSRDQLFWHWLQVRREEADDLSVLPGRIFGVAHGVLWKGLGVMGILLGVAAAAGLLRYDGLHPVNVATFFGFLVLMQVGLVILASATVVLRKTRLLSEETSWMVGWFRALWAGLAVRFHWHLMARLPGERRQQIRSFLGALATRRSLYGHVLIWPFVTLTQWFGVMFNIGALVATLLLVTVSDRAFGWQSAVQFDPEQIHTIVRTTALPWSWWLPEGQGLPTLSEVAGSQIILKEGIRSLTTTDLVSWWPFLCLSLAVYGLCPRLILLLVSHWMGRRALRRVDFSHVACDRLYERMTSGILETRGTSDMEQGRRSDAGQGVSGQGTAAADDPSLAAQPAAILMEPDIYEAIDRDGLRENLSRLLRCHPKWELAVREDPLELESVWNRLAELPWDNHVPRVILVQEAWQPPIAETMEFLKRLREVLGRQARVIVVLIGKPDRSNLLTPARDEDFNIWRSQLAQLGDSKLRLERLMSDV